MEVPTAVEGKLVEVIVRVPEPVGQKLVENDKYGIAIVAKDKVKTVQAAQGINFDGGSGANQNDLAQLLADSPTESSKKRRILAAREAARAQLLSDFETFLNCGGGEATQEKSPGTATDLLAQFYQQRS